jgi:malonyl-CoA decarboxylase
VARASTLSDFWSTIIGQPRRILRGNRPEKLEILCQDLLKEQTEVSSLQIATDIFAGFLSLDREEQIHFFKYLNEEFDVDPLKIQDASAMYEKERSPANYLALARATEPRRYELLRRLNQPPGATAELVRMRADLRSHLKDNPDLARTDTDFSLMLRAWFNRGFLEMRQITWDSPASILEKIIEYESVHEIGSWEELRRRLHPADRRCFAFFHPAMPDDPLIFVEVALAKGVPSSIQDVLADNRDILSEGDADTAVFYSISNCQMGLAGISFGNSLIKQVARDLSIELEGLSSFVTLSPIPGLNRWIKDHGMDLEQVHPNMRQLAAHYLTTAKDSKGAPLDPVARFHLSNGAQIFAVHSGADLSENGLRQSNGVMVNYLYELDKIVKNLSLYGKKEQVAASNKVRSLARKGSSFLNQNGVPATERSHKSAQFGTAGQ